MSASTKETPLILFAPSAGSNSSSSWIKHWARLLGTLGTVCTTRILRDACLGSGGPVVLAGLLGRKNLTPDKINGPEGPDEKNTIEVASIKGNTTGNSVNWIEPVKGEKLKFKTVGQSANVDLTPLNEVMDERYTVYFKVSPTSA